MASLITVRLNKGDSPSLGFRLHGGKDFGTPLVIQKVNGGSPAERAGLLAGDSVIKINNVDVFNLRHKDAQDVIVRAGPAFEVTVQRGGSTWKPSVTPTGNYTSPTPSVQNVSPVTKTSLAATKKENIGAIGTGHNVAAKPFGGQVNGTVNGGPRVVNNQYNSPLKLYSEESIAETLSAQTEVLSTGALGVNFKKNEKNYDATNSAVYRMLQEAENEPRGSEGTNVTASDFYATQSHAVGGGRQAVTSPRADSLSSSNDLSNNNHNQPQSQLRESQQQQQHQQHNSNITASAAADQPVIEGLTKCTDCERVIVGVFVRIKDKNLHVECFKCSTCGSSLKNVGYYNINNKLYCDVHAKLAARTNPPGPNLVPVTVPPGGKAPASAISAALSSHSLPSPSPLSPRTNLSQPFQLSQEDKPASREADLSAPLQNLSITNQSNTSSYNKSYNNSLLNKTPLSFDKYISKAGSYSSPRPFSSVNAPVLTPAYNTLPKAAPPLSAPLSPPVSSIASTFSPSTEICVVENVIWPPLSQQEPDLPTACSLYYPPPSQVKVKTLPRPGEEPEIPDDISESTVDFELNELNLMDQQPLYFVSSTEVSNITGRRSAVECIETISEKVETQKLIENVIKKTGPTSDAPPSLDQDVFPSAQVNVEVKTSLKECDQVQGVVDTSDDSKLKRLTEFTPNTVECRLKNQIENSIPQGWESPLLQALKTAPPVDGDPFTQIPTKFSATPLASALAVAPSEPFTPQADSSLKIIPLPEETEPYFPPEHPVISEGATEEKSSSTVSGPRGAKKKDPTADILKELPKPDKIMTMRDALCTASPRPYSPFVEEALIDSRSQAQSTAKPAEDQIERQNLQKPLKVKTLPQSFRQGENKPVIPTYPLKTIEKHEEYIKEKSKVQEKQVNVTESSVVTTDSLVKQDLASVSAITEGSVQSQQLCCPLFTGFSCSFQNKTDHSQFSIEISTASPVPTTDVSHTSTVTSTRNEEISSKTETSKTETTVKKETQQVTKQNQKSIDAVKQSKEVTRQGQKSIDVIKQAEDVILKKPLPLAALHKPEGLPQYQVTLEENAEADILLYDKQQAASRFHEKQKSASASGAQTTLQQSQQSAATSQNIVARTDQTHIQQSQKSFTAVDQNSITTSQSVGPDGAVNQQSNQQAVAKPIITIQSDDLRPSSDQCFRPVSQDQSPKTTFSPRPGAITPSLINKPPPIIPYYQYNLVAQPCRPVSANLLDPASPNVSRSPSPCPDRRSPVPLASSSGVSAVRPKSPAQGPPPNVKASAPRIIQDSKIEKAKDNITTYIPQHQAKDVETTRQVQITNTGNGSSVSQAASSFSLDHTVACNVSETQASSVKAVHSADLAASYSTSKNIQGGFVTTNVLQQAQLEQLQQVNESKTRTVETSNDGLVQVQRTKRVKKEFESVHKSNLTQIEKNVTSVKCHKQCGFRNVNVSADEQNVLGFHITNPQPIKSPFVQADVTRSKSEVSQMQESKSAGSASALTASQTQREQTRAVPPGLAPAPVAVPVPPSIPTSAPKPSPLTKHVIAPSTNSPVRHVTAPSTSKQRPSYAPGQGVDKPSTTSQPNAGSSGGRQAGAVGIAPKRGRGIINPASIGGARIPLCGHCHGQIRGPFITALGKIWCPDHFICATPSCRRPLQDLGFVEEQGQLYCEYCFEQYLAPTCSKCNHKIKEDCLKAIGKHFHPECFTCVYCGKLFANSPFFLEEGNPYCETDWNELFTTKCFACGFPVEAGDRWVEALNNNYHSQCFNCTMCKKNLEGQSFFAKGGRPFCKNHAR